MELGHECRDATKKQVKTLKPSDHRGNLSANCSEMAWLKLQYNHLMNSQCAIEVQVDTFWHTGDGRTQFTIRKVVYKLTGRNRPPRTPRWSYDRRQEAQEWFMKMEKNKLSLASSKLWDYSWSRSSAATKRVCLTDNHYQPKSSHKGQKARRNVVQTNPTRLRLFASFLINILC